MRNFAGHKWWFVTLLLSLPVIALAAVPNLFTANSVLKSSQLNENFKALDDRLAALEANPNAGAGCYVHWGMNGCAAGYSEVLKGHPGGLESFKENAGGGGYGNLECVSDVAAVKTSFASTTFPTTMMIANATGNGMSALSGACSICCRSGCYTALGTSTCAAGYSPVYSGRVGGVESYGGAQAYSKTLCMDGSAPPTYTWTTGYPTRLMRHRPSKGTTTDGMDQVDASCAVCCR